jgi:hypothetical protein
MRSAHGQGLFVCKVNIVYYWLRLRTALSPYPSKTALRLEWEGE